MSAYYNPYNFYQQPYANPTYTGNYAYPSPTSMPAIQQSMSSSTIPENDFVMKWVEGEIGAKAFNMPVGWPANRPIPLWDSTDTVIWLKSWGPMGIPNPMQRLEYKMPEQQSYHLPSGQQNSSGAPLAADGTMITDNNEKFATKDDLINMKNEIRELLKETQQNYKSNASTPNNQNGSRGEKR